MTATIPRAQSGGARQVEVSGHPQDDGHQAQGQQHRRVADHQCRYEPRGAGGDQLKAGQFVVLPQVPPEGKHVDELPEEEDSEEGHAAGVDGAGVGGPADKRGQRARDRADGGRQRGAELEGGVDGVVEEGGGSRDERGQPAEPEPDVARARHHQDPAEEPRVRRRDPSRGDGAQPGAYHDGVRFALQILVQGQRARGAQAGAQDQVEDVWENDVRQGRHQIAGDRREGDEEGDTGLGQLQIRRDPPGPLRPNAILDGHSSPRTRPPSICMV